MTDSPATTIIIFGASGDLTSRKLIPALYISYSKQRLPENFNIIGFARRPWDDAGFRAQVYAGMEEFAPQALENGGWEAFAQRLFYVQGDLETAVDYQKLETALNDLENGHGNRLYYLATAPRFFVPVVKHLGAHAMAGEATGWRRIVVEKPFGNDLASARTLSDDLHAVFAEHQIYRIDHYLGKETAQNLLYFRFANTIFEPLWNRNYVDNVQIMVAESVDVAHRAGYYDQAGVLRDMFQNHLLQLLSLVAMEAPASFDADAVRNEKVKLLQSVRPISLPETVRAQYSGYRESEGVAENTQTATYAALQLNIDNWRWQGVPFYLRSGKALKRKASEIIIEFQPPPHLMFATDEDFVPNVLAICIQPDEGIHLKFEAKVPDSRETRSADLEFHYQSAFKATALPDAYERLLLDALKGDATLFARSDGIDAAWSVIDPVLTGWASSSAPAMTAYAPGSWGPPAADDLLRKNGRVWRYSCGDHG